MGQVSTLGLATTFVITPVPEPSTYALLLLGTGLLALSRWRLSKRKEARGVVGWACRLDNFENTLVENNIVSSLHSFPIQHLNSQAVTAFNNLTPAGTRLPIYNDTAGHGGDPNAFRREDGLEDKIQDALIVSLL